MKDQCLIFAFDLSLRFHYALEVLEVAFHLHVGYDLKNFVLQERVMPNRGL